MTDTKCTVPPKGWYCTRQPGHEGPCAAIPDDPDVPVYRDIALTLNDTTLNGEPVSVNQVREIARMLDITPREPMQPVVMVNNITRFRKNEIVQMLLDVAPVDLNNIAGMDYSQEDRDQFNQLIGYSVGGYEDLSNVSDESKDRARAMANRVYEKYQAKKNNKSN